jgi:hypothetical protein
MVEVLHVTQAVAVVQVRQGRTQAEQTLPLVKDPEGQVLTQVLLGA